MTDFYRVSGVVPEFVCGGIADNAAKIHQEFLRLSRRSAVVFFPEYALTGGDCGDLLCWGDVQNQLDNALSGLIKMTESDPSLLVFGLPLAVDGLMLNTLAAVQNNRLAALVFQVTEANRHLVGKTVSCGGCEAVLQSAAALEAADGTWEIGIGFSRSLERFSARTRLILLGCRAPAGVSDHTPENLKMLANTSGACAVGLCGNESSDEFAYLPCACGAHPEGKLLQDSSYIELDFAPRHLESIFRRDQSNWHFAGNAPEVSFQLETFNALPAEEWKISRRPSIPGGIGQAELLDAVLAMQSRGIARRLQDARLKTMVLGVSGGLDSTWAILAANEVKKLLPDLRILAISMPGFGTSNRTKSNAEILAGLLGAEFRTIPISAAVSQHFADIGHDPECRNIVYENSQARERTQILMDIANGCGGLVLGTGDLSETALGWCTFNGDQMAMYNVNASLTKTLIRCLAGIYADQAEGELKACLLDIVNTPVSPELLPGSQETEAVLGDYELLDFYLYYLVQCSESRENLLLLAKAAFADTYSDEELERTLNTFCSRFVTQQFKRNCAPDGINLPGCSLSRSQWQMPSNISVNWWK